ncbi:MAG: ion channel [Anaeromyxobacteraceae bacterium]
MPSPRVEVLQADGYQIRIVGVPRPRFGNLYHWLLRAGWGTAFAALTSAYLALNVAFALLFLVSGGVANARPGSFLDAFFFSIQTMGTIGYGAMYPASPACEAVVAAESVTGLVFTAVATGLMFVRFSLTRSYVVFSTRVAVAPMDGVPTLMFRVGNERRGRIVGATFGLTFLRSERTTEGMPIYRTVDLALVRSRADALARSWTVLHRIEPGSPLYGETPASLAARDAELTLSVSGMDETTRQTVHAQRTWSHAALAWGARLDDAISETPGGDLVLDLRKFDALVPTRATEGFPYGEGGQEAP